MIKPGVTTTDDVVWCAPRADMARLGLDTWFHPSVRITRQGTKNLLEDDTVIQKGDLLWTDFGITYLRLNTDTQHLAYVLKPGETRGAGRPARRDRGGQPRAGRADVLVRHRVPTGNDVLAKARAKAIAAGLKPSIYSHPLGYHGHAAGPAIGFWDNQNGDERGAFGIHPNTTWSIELSAFAPVPEWGGQEVQFRLEEAPSSTARRSASWTAARRR